MIVSQIPVLTETIEHSVSLVLNTKVPNKTHVLKLGIVEGSLCYKLEKSVSWKKMMKVNNLTFASLALDRMLDLNTEKELVNVHEVLPVFALLSGEKINNYKV